jgi:hypothetical protein
MSDITRALEPVITPLAEGEERRAIQAAVAYLIQDIGGGTEPRYRVLGAELSINKPLQPRTLPPRLIRVLIVDYGNQRNLNVVVDDRGEVVQMEDLAGYQPAFADEEVQEALGIAEHDDRVARLASLPRSFVSTFGPARDPQERARLVGLRYAVDTEDEQVRILARAVVDLSNRILVSFRELQPDESGGN